MSASTAEERFEAEIAAEMSADTDGPPDETDSEPEQDTPLEGPELEPEPASNMPVLTEALTRKIDAENKRHENALGKLYGDAWEDYNMCPLCVGDGYLIPVPAGAMPDDLWQVVEAFAGHVDTGTYRHPDELVACERCDGWGQVLTGARADTTASIPCSLCDARGYFNLSDPIQNARLHPPAQLPAPTPLYPQFHTEPSTTLDASPSMPLGWDAQGKPGADSFGRWPGHPRYGIDPAANGGVW